jgi:stage V sporulation protein B
LNNQPPSFTKIILASTSIIFVLLIIQRLFGFLLNSLLTKTITPAEYGSYTFAWSVAQFAVGIFLLGVSPATSYFVAYHRGAGDQQQVNNYVKTGLITVLTLIFIIGTGFFTVNRLNPSILSLDRVLVAFMLFMFTVHAIGFFFMMVIAGYRRPEITVAFATLFPIASYGLVFAAKHLGYGFHGALAGIAAAFFLTNIAGAVYALTHYSFRGRFRKPLVKRIIAFGIPLILIDVANSILWWGDLFIIKAFTTFSNVGIYWAATITANILLLSAEPVSQIFSPIATELFGKKDTPRLSFMTSYIFERYILFSLPLLASLVVFAGGILQVVFTEDYIKGELSLQILALAVFLIAASLIFRRIITASGKPKAEAKILAIAATANILLNIPLVKYLGITGAAIATLLTSTIILAASYRFAKTSVTITLHKNRIAKILAATLISFTAIYIVKILFTNLLLALFIAAPTLIITYLTSLILLKAFREEDVSLLDTILQQIELPQSLEKIIVRLLKKGIS